jgi:polyphosphate kinase 2 (PPK2 family)
MVNYCTTVYAPWYVIPADQKWYRNLALMRAIVAALQEMNPQYPHSEEDLSNVVII